MPAWDNRFKKVPFFIGVLLLILFAGSGIFLIFLQTTPGRSLLTSWLSKALEQERGWTIQAERIEGSLPHEIILHNAVIESESDRIEATLIDAKLSLLPLLKKEISFTQLNGQGIRWTKKEARAPSFQFPYVISVSKLRLKEITLPNGAKVDAIGSLKFGPTSAAKLKISQESASMLLSMTIKKQEIALRLDAQGPSIAALKPWIDVLEEGSFEGSLSLKGHLTNRSLDGRLRFSSQITQSPHPELLGAWKGSSALHLDESTIQLIGAQLRGAALLAQGDLKLLEGALQSARARFSVSGLDKLGTFPISGAFTGHLQVEGNSLSASGAARSMQYDGFEMQQLKATVQLSKSETGWQGASSATGHFFDIPWEAQADLAQSGGRLAFEKLAIEAPGFKAEGQLQALPEFSGTLKASVPNLHDLIPSFYGALEGDFYWNPEDFGGDVALEEGYYETLHVEELKASLHEKQFLLTAQQSDWKELLIDQLSLRSTQAPDQSWPFSIEAAGDWKGAFALSGFGRQAEQEVVLQSLTGTLNGRPLRLEAPLQFDRKGFQELSLSIGSSHLLIDGPNRTLSARAFPIQLLPLHLSISGTLDCEATLHDQEGSLHAEVRDVELLGGSAPLLNGHALLDAKLKGERLEIACKVEARNKPLLRLDTMLPVKIKLPFTAEVLPYRPMSADLALDGQIEDLFDYFDIGPQRIEGQCKARLEISNTPFRPHLAGFIAFEKGLYENYYAGIRIEDIHGNATAKDNSLTFDLRGNDQIKMDGELNALWEERFPFQGRARFNELTFANVSWLDASANGELEIKGNLDSMRVSGRAFLSSGLIKIPEKIPQKVPELQIAYLHPPKPLNQEKPQTRMHYPVFLDLELQTNDQLLAQGRGLDSKWNGALQIKGTLADPELKGSLDLKEGKFSIFDRNLDLTDGKLVFNGQPHQMPLLDLGARMNLKNIAILARLMGPIDGAHLSLQSIPPLPVGSIVSYVLFGEDLSEINPIQAAKLVNSLSSLTGGEEASPGPLGVDRLRIAATPLDSEGGETTPLQVGKYVTRGVLVSVSEGTEGSASSLSVEIDLINGWSFIAESDQEEEQGKFTIKWNLNY